MNARTLLTLAIGMVAGIGAATLLMPKQVVVAPPPTAPEPTEVVAPQPTPPSAPTTPSVAEEPVRGLLDTDVPSLPARPITRPAERPELTEAEREERIAAHQDRMVMSIQSRIDELAAERGWSEETSREIENLVLDIHDARIGLFEASRRGEFSFGDMHRELGELHDEASETLDELGGEGTYTELMGRVRAGMRPPAPTR